MRRKTAKEILAEGAFLFNEQRDYLKNLLLHTKGLESFSKYMKHVHFESLRNCVLDASGMKELDIKTEMYVRTYCQGTTDLISALKMELFTEKVPL